MWIKLLQPIEIPQGSFAPDDVIVVYDALGTYLKMRGRALPANPPADLDARFALRLKQGEGEPALFLPFVGEFGHLCMYHMRLVHFHTASRKVVCCKPGFEIFYPSADEFDYDWTNPISDDQRAGTERVRRDWPEIARRHPGHRPIQGGNTSLAEETIVLCPGEKIPLKPRTLRGLRVDVCIGTRARKMDTSKNWQHWTEVAAAIQAMGLTVGVIGTRETSYPIDGAIMSGDYGDCDAAVEMLQNCSCFLGGDSGCAHLAAVVGCRMLVMPVPVSKRYLPRMEQENPGNVQFFDDAHWNDLNAAIERATAFVRQSVEAAPCKRES